MREEIIGDCRLILGDCRDILPTVVVDVIVTDPPYGIAWTKPELALAKSRAHAGIANDDTVEARDAVLEWHGSGRAIVFGSFQAPFPPRVKQVLVWHKPGDSGLFGTVAGYRRDVEPIFVCGDWPKETVKRSSVLTSAASFRGHAAKETGSHPHTKPCGLMAQLLEPLDRSDVVLDPFMGSGTTGVACVALGLSFIGVEIDEAHFSTACRRIEEAYRQPRLFSEAPIKPVQEALAF